MRCLALSILIAAPLLAGCSAPDKSYTKSGISVASAKRDSDKCWSFAQRTNISDEQKAVNIAAGVIGAGIIGGVTLAVMNEEIAKDPKNTYRRAAHDACMRNKGYRTADG